MMAFSMLSDSESLIIAVDLMVKLEATPKTMYDDWWFLSYDSLVMCSYEHGSKEYTL